MLLPAAMYNKDKYTLIFQKPSWLFMAFIYLPQRTATVSLLSNFSDSTVEETGEIKATEQAVCLYNKLFDLEKNIFI